MNCYSNWGSIAFLIVSISAAPGLAWSETTLSCVRTINAPVIDGIGDEQAWKNTKVLKVADSVAELEHQLACVFDSEQIYIKAVYPDESESRTHKTSVWDTDSQFYNHGPDREDTLILKWNMDDDKGDLSISSDAPYKADIWYWKAWRTDPMGYADDKTHIYSNVSLKKSKKQLSKRGNRFYLARPGDKGTSAYKPIIHIEHTGDNEIDSYIHREPTGSRADVKAKGNWSNGVWTIEFSRKLDTGYADDVRFRLDRPYQLGVSRYEIAGTEPVKNSNNPNHGNGEIGESITLTFKESLASQ